MKNLNAATISFIQTTDILTLGTITFKAVTRTEIGQDLESDKPYEFIQSSEIIEYIDIHENGIEICNCRAHKLLFFGSYLEKGIDLMDKFDKLAMQWLEYNKVNTLSESIFITMAKSTPHYPIKFNPEPEEKLHNTMDLELKTNNHPSGFKERIKEMQKGEMLKKQTIPPYKHPLEDTSPENNYEQK